MAYKALLNNSIFFQTDSNDLVLTSAKLERTVGTAGSFTFTIPPNNVYYNSFRKIIDFVDVYRDEDLLFSGRVYSITETFDTQLKIVCEGLLAVLNDSILRPVTYQGELHGLVRQIIQNHNSQVESAKQVQVGRLLISNSDCYRAYQNYETSISRLQDLVESYGGWMRIRRENGVNYFDWYEANIDGTTQRINFGENLLDVKQEENADGICTVLIPLGAANDNNVRIDIKTVNDGLDYIEASSEYIQKYGYVVASHIWDDVNYPSILKTKAQQYLNACLTPRKIINVTAVDLADAGYDVDAFNVGQKIRVYSAPHDINGEWFDCTTQSLDLLNPAQNKLTLGSEKIGYIKAARSASAEVRSSLERIAATYAPLSVMEQSIERATSIITGNSGGYIILHDSNNDGEPDELLIMDTPDIDTAVKVWRFNNAGLGYSSTGYDGTYGLAMTMDGQIVADYITTGTMSADRIKTGILQGRQGSSYWNLDTGVINIEGYATDADIQDLQDQIDGSIQSWSGTDAPTLSNYPASQWTDTATRRSHIGDVYYDADGNAYRFVEDGSTFKWITISDSDVGKALADAAEALDEIDTLNNTLVTNYYTKTETNQQISNAEGRLTSQMSSNYTSKATFEAFEDDVNDDISGIRTDITATNNNVSTLTQDVNSFKTTVESTYATQAVVKDIAESTIVGYTMHYLATSAGSGVTVATTGWTTTVQSMTETKKYLWTYMTYEYGDGSTTNTTPVISGVYGNKGTQGDKGDKGDTGRGISLIVPVWYAKADNTAPEKPTTAVVDTGTGGGAWTLSLPSINPSYPFLYTCNQVMYTDGTYSWSDVTLDTLNDAVINLRSRVTTAETRIDQTDDEIELLAQQVTTVADKSKVFRGEPVPPYEVNDLWITGRETYGAIAGIAVAGQAIVGWGGDIYVSTRTREYGDSFNREDWQKATKYVDESGFNVVLEEVNQAKIDINAANAEIALIASASTDTLIGQKLNQAQVRINAQDAVIESKVSQTDYNGETIVSMIEQTPSSVKISASKVDLEGKVTISDLNTSTRTTLRESATPHYVTCTTGATAAAKTATLSDFELNTGSTVVVYFRYANTATNPTLNIGGTGAKPIYVKNARITAAYYWAAYDTVTFIYDGTNWVMSESSANAVLANWCYNNDKTVINGGVLATGTVAANKIETDAVFSQHIEAQDIDITGGKISIQIPEYYDISYLELIYSQYYKSYFGLLWAGFHASNYKTYWGTEYDDVNRQPTNQYIAFQYQSTSYASWLNYSSLTIRSGSTTRASTLTGQSLTLQNGTRTAGVDVNNGSWSGSVVYADYVWAKQGVQDDSDARRKKNIKYLDKDKAAEFIYSLKPASFEFLNDTSKWIHHGFITQDIRPVMYDGWQLIVKNPDGFDSMATKEIIADLVATVQSQNERIKMLEERLS